MPTRTVTRPQDDLGLFEVEAVRSAVVKLHPLVRLLAVHNHTGLITSVENAAAKLLNAADQAEEEIMGRQKLITK